MTIAAAITQTSLHQRMLHHYYIPESSTSFKSGVMSEFYSTWFGSPFYVKCILIVKGFNEPITLWSLKKKKKHSSLVIALFQKDNHDIPSGVVPRVMVRLDTRPERKYSVSLIFKTLVNRRCEFSAPISKRPAHKFSVKINLVHIEKNLYNNGSDCLWYPML